MIKRSNRYKAFKESRRRWDFGNGGSGEWTYEGKLTRYNRCRCDGCDRYIARRMKYADESAKQFAKLGGTAG